MIKNGSKSIPMIALVAAMLLWSTSFIALKIAFKTYDPMFVIFMRMFIASILFIGIFAFVKGKLFEYRKGDLKYIMFMAICEPCLYFLFEANALENTTASQAGMITSMLPVMVAIAAVFFLNEKLSFKIIGGFALTIAGALLLSYGAKKVESSPNPGLGNFYEFLAMICATGYTVSLKYLSKRYKPLFLTAFQAFIGAIFFFPFLFTKGTQLPVHFEAIPVVAIVYLGSFITLGAYGLYNFGVSKIPASQASLFVNLIPLFTIILAFLVLDETFTKVQYLASIMVLAGLYITQKKERKL
ncbi:MAG: DMT family transporter [Desulfobacterales bacterium]|nr:DMT family transporter [Desulfobacterales bacterium]